MKGNTDIGTSTGDHRKNGIALILGGSSGLGLASAKKLADHGYDLAIVHRDRKSDLQQVEEEFRQITLKGCRLKSFNLDALNSTKRASVVEGIKAFLEEGQKVGVLIHSIAKGNLKPMQSVDDRTLDHQDFHITLGAMAISLYDWTQALVQADLFIEDSRIISFTSEGNSRAYSGYAAVSAAKAALEAITRNIALEFAPKGIKANCIQAGVTETRSFQMIPGHRVLKKNAIARNPNKRLTTPADIANVVYLLTTPEARWITGTVIKVDGGESLQ